MPHTTITPPAPIHFPTDAEVAADLAREFAEIAARRRHAPSTAEIHGAIAQLRRSERGTSCLKAFDSMLHAYGFGLDSDNWQALATLHRAGAATLQREIADAIDS